MSEKMFTESQVRSAFLEGFNQALNDPVRCRPQAYIETLLPHPAESPKQTVGRVDLSGAVESIIQIWHGYEEDLERANPGEQDDVVSIRIRLSEFLAHLQAPDRALTLYLDSEGVALKAGDVFDIGQTVNGQSEFFVSSLDPLDIRYNFYPRRKYEYSMTQLLAPDKFTGESTFRIIKENDYKALPGTQSGEGE